MIQWIDFKEKEPLFADYIVFESEDKIYAGMYVGKQLAIPFYLDPSTTKSLDFTHWMPLNLKNNSLENVLK